MLSFQHYLQKIKPVPLPPTSPCQTHTPVASDTLLSDHSVLRLDDGTNCDDHHRLTHPRGEQDPASRHTRRMCPSCGAHVSLRARSVIGRILDVQP